MEKLNEEMKEFTELLNSVISNASGITASKAKLYRLACMEFIHSGSMLLMDRMHATLAIEPAIRKEMCSEVARRLSCTTTDANDKPIPSKDDAMVQWTEKKGFTAYTQAKHIRKDADAVAILDRVACGGAVILYGKTPKKEKTEAQKLQEKIAATLNAVTGTALIDLKKRAPETAAALETLRAAALKEKIVTEKN